MARKRAITPVTEELKMNSITFGATKIADFGRIDETTGWVRFHTNLRADCAELFERMGWLTPENRCSRKNLDGVLSGGYFILSCQDKLVDAEVNIEFQSIKGFECHRFELEGRKKKGFRRELRFRATFKCQDGAANLESYQIRTANSRGSLKVVYLKEQETPGVDENQLQIPEVIATDEQRSAVREMTAGR